MTDCWTLSLTQLENFRTNKVILHKSGATIFDADKFVDMAPRGIYFFEANEIEDTRVQYSDNEPGDFTRGRVSLP